ncbi:MAG: BamA/TamA family outer membrane protein [Gemmatimonadaceae bacterium]|nr:BamA/TamA family outer membrane protein [Gemmatimonadaceae bacterium]
MKVEDLEESVSTEASHCKSFLLKPFCLITKSKYVYEKKYLDHDELARDVLRIRVFYWKRGYRDAQVDTSLVANGKNKVQIAFRITEGPPTIVSTLDIRQDSQVLRPHDIERRLALSVGTPLNLLRLDSTRAKLMSALWDRGFGDAEIDTSLVVDEVNHKAALSLLLHPKWKTTVAAIDIVGENRVTERTIRKSLTFKPGDVFRRTEMLRSQRALYESNLFKRAVLDLPVQGDSNKLVVVTVQESPPREVRLSAGFSTVDFFQVEGRYLHYNWFGSARRFAASAAVGNLLASSLNGKGIFRDVSGNIGSDRARYFAPTYNASIEVRQPWWGSPHNEAAASIFAHRRSAPGIFVDRGYGTSLTFTRNVTFRAPASANYRFEISQVEAGDVYFCINYGVCDQPTLHALREKQRLSPFTINMQIDRTNDPLGPSRGIRGSADLEHASSLTISDFRYNRATLDAAAFMPFRSRGVIGGHVRMGWVNALESTGAALGAAAGGDILHPRKRFYAGGSRSVRGFGENQLGPRVLTISAAQLQRKDSLNAPCHSGADMTACNPNVAGLANRDFEPRALGGNIVVEANAELRFPVWKDLSGAAFIDGGYVSQRINSALPKSKAAVTPGVGIRYLTRVGPVRVDLALSPTGSELLPVVTEQVVNGEVKLVNVKDNRRYAPARGLLNRMQLHLSIGEAF